MGDHFSDVSNVITQELDINVNEKANEQDLIDAIALRVMNYMDGEIELLFSYLYRLDIQEEKINTIMNEATEDPTHVALAKLIYTRQMERVKTKQTYKQEPIEGWDEW